LSARDARQQVQCEHKRLAGGRSIDLAGGREGIRNAYDHLIRSQPIQFLAGERARTARSDLHHDVRSERGLAGPDLGPVLNVLLVGEPRRQPGT
jgi:hypothetical protein